MTNIRYANKEDSKFIAQLMMLPMDEIVYNFIGEEDFNKGVSFLEELIKEKNNQYSYQNTIVVEIDGQIIGSSTFYDGKLLDELRKPVLELLESKYNRKVNPEDETQEGEIYIDTIAIAENQQGKGLGTKILDFLIEEICVKQNNTLGLIVDLKKPNAKKLYERKGFTVVGSMNLMGVEHEHMQIKI